MIPETQVHVIARQMVEKHGFEAIAMAAQNAVASERKGDAEEAKEWRHIEAAMKLMRVGSTPASSATRSISSRTRL